MGNPPPIPLAIGTISGFNFRFFKSKKSPDLEIPHCTSSNINNIFFLLHSFLNSFKQKSGITFIPDSTSL